MISLGPIQDELRGRYPDLDLSLDTSPFSDHVIVKDRSGELTRVNAETIFATPSKQLVNLFKHEVEVALAKEMFTP